MAGKIIIIEDNPADAKMLQIAFNRHDPTIQTCVLTDGAAAVAHCSPWSTQELECPAT